MIKLGISVLVATLLPLCACAQPVDEEVKSPLEVAQALLAAYNAGDLEGVANLYAESAALYILPATDPVYEGRAAIRSAYADQLENNCLSTMRRACPDLHGTISSWQVLDRWVSTVEHVTLENGVPPLTYMLTYEVVDGQIQSAWFMVDSPR